MRRLTHQILTALLLLTLFGAAHGALISRTITIDGNISDWTSPTNILTNPGQFSADCEGTIAPGSGGCDLDYQVQSTGRDLKTFSFTWDTNNIYLFVGRYASLSNATDWWFYLDTNNSSTQEDNEPVVHVSWQGSNRDTTVEICRYNAVNNSTGDSLTDPNTGNADGYDMPGPLFNHSCVQQYKAKGGASTGTEMEIAIAWTALGLSQPANVGFHISSSNGTNIPNQLDDNMGGPGGASVLFPPDMAISKSASAATVQAGNTVTYTILLENLLFDDFSSITVDDQLPAQFTYLSHTVSAGSFVDTDADSVPDQWQLASLPAQTSETLTITALALNVPLAINTTNTATISASAEADNDASNDSSSAVVQVLPAPELTVTKVSSSANVDPGSAVRFTVSISNIATVAATNVAVEDQLPQFVAFAINTFGAATPFRFTDGATPSGLTLGTPSYSDDGGITYTYTPMSGGGGAPAGYDANVTHFRVPMTGTMNANGASFQLEYDTVLR
ncbi:MAG: DUF11 domain-containing protein [Alcanivoracaceae bacterium]|nr:DUF11 domain-containing protein [Alcanivoracaceae bacterium]